MIGPAAHRQGQSNGTNLRAVGGGLSLPPVYVPCRVNPDHAHRRGALCDECLNAIAPIDPFAPLPPKEKKERAVKGKKAGQELNLDVLALLLAAGWVRDVDFVKEYYFSDERDWRFDFAFTRVRVAVEADGRVHDVVQEKRGKDREKSNEAAALGWRVLRVTRKTVNDGTAIELVKRAVAYGATP